MSEKECRQVEADSKQVGPDSRLGSKESDLTAGSDGSSHWPSAGLLAAAADSFGSRPEPRTTFGESSVIETEEIPGVFYGDDCSNTQAIELESVSPANRSKLSARLRQVAPQPFIFGPRGQAKDLVTEVPRGSMSSVDLDDGPPTNTWPMANPLRRGQLESAALMGGLPPGSSDASSTDADASSTDDDSQRRASASPGRSPVNRSPTRPRKNCFGLASIPKSPAFRRKRTPSSSPLHTPAKFNEELYSPFLGRRPWGNSWGRLSIHASRCQSAKLPARYKPWGGASSTSTPPAPGTPFTADMHVAYHDEMLNRLCKEFPDVYMIEGQPSGFVPSLALLTSQDIPELEEPISSAPGEGWSGLDIHTAAGDEIQKALAEKIPKTPKDSGRNRKPSFLMGSDDMTSFLRGQRGSRCGSRTSSRASSQESALTASQEEDYENPPFELPPWLEYPGEGGLGGLGHMKDDASSFGSSSENEGESDHSGFSDVSEGGEE